MSEPTTVQNQPERIPSWDEIRAMFAKSRAEDDRRRAEDDRRRAEEQAEDARRKVENDRMLRELGQKIAGLGDKFGYFTEGLALPTMEKILKHKFAIESVSPRMKFERNGRNLEFDVFGLSAGTVKRIVIVEVKSRVRRYCPFQGSL